MSTQHEKGMDDLNKVVDDCTKAIEKDDYLVSAEVSKI